MEIERGDLTTIRASQDELLEVMYNLLNIARFGGAFSFSIDGQPAVTIIRAEERRR